MTIYDGNAQTRLMDKLDYELWLLDYLSSAQASFEGGTDICTIQLKNKEKGAKMTSSVADYAGAGYVQSLMTAMAPLTFCAAYKVLDMVYEWIFEENLAVKIIEKEPWGFAGKVKQMTNPKLKYPPIVAANSYLFEYGSALFRNLLPYRNEIIHNHKFSVSGETIALEDSKTGDRLDLDRKELGYFVRFVIAFAKCLAGELMYDQYVDRLFRFHLDQIPATHKLPTFGQKKPLRVNVELTVEQECGKYVADLQFVRFRLKEMYAHCDVLFSLAVIGTEDDKRAATWNIPFADIPIDDTIELPNRTDDFEGVRDSG